MAQIARLGDNHGGLSLPASFVPRVVHMVHPLVHGGLFCISFHFNDLKQYRGSGGPKPRGCAPLEPPQKSSTFLHLPTCNCPGWSGIVYRCTLTISGEFSMSSAIESGLVIESFDTLASRP